MSTTSITQSQLLQIEQVLPTIPTIRPCTSRVLRIANRLVKWRRFGRRICDDFARADWASGGSEQDFLRCAYANSFYYCLPLR